MAADISNASSQKGASVVETQFAGFDYFFPVKIIFGVGVKANRWVCQTPIRIQSIKFKIRIPASEPHTGIKNNDLIQGNLPHKVYSMSGEINSGLI